MNPQDLCPECGSDRRSGSFCDTCGAVLHWTRPSAPPIPEAQPPAADGRPSGGVFQAPDDGRPSGGVSAAAPSGEDHRGEWSRAPRGDEADDHGQAADEDDTATIDVGGAGAGPSTDAIRADVLERGGPGPENDASTDHATERARRLLVPVAEVKERESVEPEVAPVLPGRPRQARPRARAAEPEAIDGGGVLCPWCGTANPHERRFCRQCAMSLVAAEGRETRTRSWWRRLFDRDGREAPWAGERPRLRRGVSRMVVMVVAVAVVIGLVVVVAVYVGPAVDAVRDHFAKRVQVTPGGSGASHSDPRNGPAKAFDGLSDTYWGDGYGGPGFGQFVEATFTQPQTLLNVIITPGISKRPDLYATQGRPQILEATVFSSDGGSTTRSLQLDDIAGPQKFRLRGADVVRVRLTIRAAFGAATDRQVAIAEVEFFARTARKTD